MQTMALRVALIAIVAFAGPMLLPEDASAQYREFAGKVAKVTDTQLFVDNRKGDKLTFTKRDDTAVEGERASWGEIKQDDWVSVSWKMMDSPRKAYKVVVMRPKEE